MSMGWVFVNFQIESARVVRVFVLGSEAREHSLHRKKAFVRVVKAVSFLCFVTFLDRFLRFFCIVLCYFACAVVRRRTEQLPRK